MRVAVLHVRRSAEPLTELEQPGARHPKASLTQEERFVPFAGHDHQVARECLGRLCTKDHGADFPAFTHDTAPATRQVGCQRLLPHMPHSPGNRCRVGRGRGLRCASHDEALQGSIRRGFELLGVKGSTWWQAVL